MSSLTTRLLPLATRSALRAIGAGVAHAPFPAAAVVGALVTGLAGESISTLLSPAAPGASRVDDLDRVAKLALLTILHQTLTDHGLDSTGADEAVQRAAETWDLRIFRDFDPTDDQILHAQALAPDQSLGLARQITRPIAGAPLQEFADAIVARFPDTFEAVLRGDERGFRAATICLLRLSHEMLANLRGDFSAAITALTRPQPHLELYEDRRKTNRAIEITDLQFKRRATRFRPRPALEKQLRDWILSTDPFRVLKLTGSAGMGKSRLAIELCDWCYAQHWLAGFVPGVDAAWPENWRPLQDTLAVVDYAASKRIGGRSVFCWIEEQLLPLRATPPGVRTRVILIDRTDQGPLWSDWRASEVARDLDALTLSLDLTPDREEFDVIVREELTRRLARRPSGEEWSTVGKVADRLRQQFRPLFALLTAAAVCDAQSVPHNTWSPELLVESILKSQLHLWSTAAVKDVDLDLLFEATLTQGACNADPAFRDRVDALDPGVYAALSALSDPGEGLGPMVPDLLGEFFLLERLRGARVLSDRQSKVAAKAAWRIVDSSWKYEPSAEYLGFLLQDYLLWKPAEGTNPAIDIMHRALDRLKKTPYTDGLGRCCFASAWRCPNLRDWSEWLNGIPSESRQAVVQVLAMGLYNATANEPDPAQRRSLADRVAALHDQHGYEPAVREQLATALFNATVVEPDSAQCLALADRIGRLHELHGHEPAVREQLANALFNAAVVEPDPAQRRALADRIAALHDQHGYEPAVREALAKALYNATVGEPDPVQRRALADRIDGLHEQHGHEPAVREPLAVALFNTTVVERDPVQRRQLADRIANLHEQHGCEPAVRERLAKAIGNTISSETDPMLRAQDLGRLADLAERFPNDATVVEALKMVRDYLATL